MAGEHHFRYVPKCSIYGCDHPAIYKIAATWSSGNLSELKNYGLSCEDHRQEQLVRARASRQEFRPAEGESLGEVALYLFRPGARDADLVRVPEGD